MQKLVIAFTGAICAGKGEAAKLTSSFLSSPCYSLGDEARAETTANGLPLSRENIRETARSTQEKFGESVWAERVVKKINSSKEHFFVVEGFRRLSEVNAFKKAFGKNFVLIAVTASFETRFKRARERKREDEPLSFKEFKELDDAELGLNKQKYCFEINACIKTADYAIENNGSLKEFVEQLTALLERIT